MRTTPILAAALVLVLVACRETQPPADGTPNTPTSVTTAVEHGIVTVSWTHDGEHTSGYRISREPSGGGDLSAQQATQVGEVAASERSFADRSAEVGVGYDYNVVAFGPEGASEPAAAPAPTSVASGVTLRVGTYIFPLIEDPLVVIGVFPYIDPAEIAAMGESVDVTVTGPEGWNGGAPWTGSFSSSSLAYSFLWTAEVTAVAGTYELEIDTGAFVHTSSASLADLSTLPFPTGVTVEDYDATSVSGSWDAHPDAVSYTATLFQGQHASSLAVENAHTKDTEYTFTGLELEPDDYFFAVYAHIIDRTDTLRIQPPERVDISLDATGLFQIE